MSTIDFTKNDTYRRAYDNILQIKKHANSKDELPTLGASNGDIYSVGEDNELYIFNSGWKPVGGDGGSKGEYKLRLYYDDSGSNELWYGDFGDLADAVEAMKSGTFKGAYLYDFIQSDFGGIYTYGKRLLAWEYEYLIKRGDSGYLIFQNNSSTVSLDIDHYFTIDSMRFIGKLTNEIREGIYDTPSDDGSPIPCYSSAYPPMVFYFSDAEAGQTLVMGDGEISAFTRNNQGKAVVSQCTLVSSDGKPYGFTIELPGDAGGDVSLATFGIIRNVKLTSEEVGDDVDVISVSWDLARSLIGSKVYIRSSDVAPAL